MKIAILTSGILPVPAVQGGAVEMLIDHYLDYNERHRLHDITVYSVRHHGVESCPQLQSTVNHYCYVDMASLMAKARKRLHGMLHRNTYYHYSIDYFLQRAMTLIGSQRYDVILLENRPAYALDIAGKTSAKLVYHLHNDFLNSQTPHAADIYGAATGILTVSDYIRHRVETCDRQHSAKCITVHNGIDLAAFAHKPAIDRQALGFKSDDLILAFSGRLVPEKGILELIEAMAMVSDLPRVKLLVMGSSFFGNAGMADPFIAQLKDKAGRLGDRITFSGYVRHELMPDYLKLADVAVIPSTWGEPFATSVLEAMAAGLPIVTTNRGGIPEMVNDQCAISINYPGPLANSLATAIRQLHGDPARRERMAKASLQRSATFDKDTYAKDFFDALAEVVATE